MHTLKTFILFSLLCCVCTCFGQTQKEFETKYNEIFAQTDSAKIPAMAKEAYQMLERNKDIQTPTNYYILKVIFENQARDPKLAKACADKADRLTREMVGKEQPEADYGSDSMNTWYKKIYPALFEVTDPDIAQKALDFLKKYTSFQSPANYNGIAGAFEKRGDYKNARYYYELSIALAKRNPAEYFSYTYYILFLTRTGEFQAAEDMIRKLEYSADTATGAFKSSYKNEALSCRTLFYYYTGDYESYVKASDKQYAELAKLYAEYKMSCTGQENIRLLNAALASEYMKNFDAAERLWKSRDSAYTAWLKCQKEQYPNLKLYEYSMAPIFLLKRGKDKQLQKPVTYYREEARTYYNSFIKYADAALSYYYGERMGFLKDPSYKEMLRPLLQRIRETRDFSQSTMPYSSYAYFMMRDNELAEAEKIYSELFTINIGWVNDIIFSLGERAFVSYYNSKLREGYDNFHSFVKLAKEKKSVLYNQLAAQDYNNLLFTKSISLQGTKKRKEAFLKNNDPAIIKLYESWLDKKQQLIREYFKSSGPSSGGAAAAATSVNNLKALQDEVNNMENELATKATDFKKLLKITPPDWTDVKSHLKDGEAAIEIIRFDWRNQVYLSDTSYYAAYIITNTSIAPEVIYLPGKPTELEGRLYTVYKNNIRFKTDDKESYNNFWKPIADNLKGISKVYLSPDGIYHLINISTLKNPATGKFVIEEMDIQSATSTSDIAVNSSTTNNTTAVLFGRPSYRTSRAGGSGSLGSGGTRSFVSGFRDENIPDLPGTETEVMSIKSEMEKGKMKVSYYVKDDATEDKLYKLQNPGIVHIATHGYWAGTGTATGGFRMFNAMANSGLLLSGVINYYNTNPYPDNYDGVLTAYEAQNLDLTNTSLVVLSACETTLGFLDAGEGVYGLQRAFRAAGAASVMTSLWKVDDNATKDFMISFYQEYLKSKDKAAAFATAQKAIKEKYIYPYYWGAFVLVGK